ncbi:CGNR zinc finger domain-containing protein [Nonomuraea roseoviolacea subsp. roseoviolacea]|uniref:RNA-binding Zn ribbon-like protein n=1 Tax=Nonomuraea roseoviolacea subsp. carminata TaxID=160689 RepID=A0ABT1JU32_9ACTN|nr:CGNR zinc finger domain-containing protein [Nonomuraea roseoviolacea]MCP2344781.1 putative RNA-binding Zn ribbon-like protein [Nonomuraea roseoviolacea subsp. carminata]
MPFGHDMVHSLATVVELVNTSPSTGGDDRLADLATLRAFVEARQVSGITTLTPRDLGQVRLVREAFHRVFTAPDQPTAVRQLNALLSETRITPRLTEHDGHPLHVHYFAPDATLSEHLAADCGVALAHLLVEGEWERLRTCSAPDCDRVFVDESRNRSRVYCDSRTCGNRMHVAAYRARRRA